MLKSEHIAVIGAGLMGHGIAQIFATQGYQVRLMDLKEEILDKAIENIRSNLTLMAQHGIGRLNEIESIIARIKRTVDLKEASSDAQFIVEAISENLELKKNIFNELDAICSEKTILSTNTSVISITEIAQKALRRDRILGTHFWNPPYLIPLVEVVRGQDTSDEVMDITIDLLRKVGKHPVRVNKDVPGFVANRLQHALWREAISIVEGGIADATTVDECVKYGFGLRLPVLGPLENADMVGLDLTLAIHEYVLKYLESSPEPSPLLREKVNRGETGFKKGHGFYKWTTDQAKELTKNLKEHLLKWTREREGN